MPTIPFVIDHQQFSPEFFINGILINPTNEFISGILTFSLNQFPQAVFTFTNLQLDLAEIIRNQNEQTNEIELRNSEQLIFKGYIQSKSLRISEGKAIVDLNCVDWCEKALSLLPVANNCCGNLKDFLEVQTGSSAVNYSDHFPFHIQLESDYSFYQNSITRWQYVVNLVSFFGGAAILQNGELKLTELTPENSQNIFTIDLDDSSSTLNLKVSPESFYKNVIIEYWSPAEQKSLSVQTNENQPLENSYILKLNQTLFNEEALLRHAQNIQQRNLLKTAVGELKTMGNTLLKTGDWISFSKCDYIPENSIYLVTAAEHTLTANTWDTLYRIGLDEEILETRASSTQKQTSHYIGKVIESSQSDPSNEFKIKVRVPALGDAEYWSRPLNAFAGKFHGSYFIPEVGSEVVLSFMDDFNDIPVVLGALYSSANPPPFNSANQCGIVTQQGNRLFFNDADQNIEISTPNGTSILLSDDHGIQLKDAFNNLLSINSNAVQVDSMTDIALNAQRNISIDGVTSKMTCSGNLTLKGTMVNIN